MPPNRRAQIAATESGKRKRPISHTDYEASFSASHALPVQGTNALPVQGTNQVIDFFRPSSLLSPWKNNENS